MRYSIKHTSIYYYNQLILLTPHLLRLQPRSDAWQKLESFQLNVDPKPEGISHFTDLDGNYLIQLWFTQPTEELVIKTESTVETYKDNPFDYLVEPWAQKIPLDYPTSLKTQLTPYLEFCQGFVDPIVLKLAQEISVQVDGDIGAFLSTLNQQIYQHCRYLHRETGDPLPPGVTWGSQEGTCRDFAVLFMEACRTMGLASRFVSGYQEGDREQDSRDLHAWAEVYLPGAGWRGYDPTHGLLVSDRHIALAASSIYSYAAPIFGSFTPWRPLIVTQLSPQSRLETEIDLVCL